MKTLEPWKITDEDIELVLLTHKVDAFPGDIQEARSKLNEDDILKKVNEFIAFDEKCDCALNLIEKTLMEDGIISPNAEKQFDPVEISA